MATPASPLHGGGIAAVSPPSVGGGRMASLCSPWSSSSLCCSQLLKLLSVWRSGMPHILFEKYHSFLFYVEHFNCYMCLVSWLKIVLSHVLLFSSSCNHGHRWMRTEPCMHLHWMCRVSGYTRTSAAGYIQHHVLPMESPELRRRCLRVVCRAKSDSCGVMARLGVGRTFLQVVMFRPTVQ